MKSRMMLIGSTLLAALFCLPAVAQPGPGMGGMGNPDNMTGMGQGAGPGMGGRMGMRAQAPRDCSQSPNPAACTAHREARAQAAEACKGMARQARRQCMQAEMQNFDCNKAANPQQCTSRKMAYKECLGQSGPAFRQCVQQKMPPVDCSKAPNQARCDLHQKARAACQDKFGPEHKTCLREQFNIK